MSDLAVRLRERLALRYMGDCKCGHCALVADDLVREAADEIERLRAEQASRMAALRDIQSKLVCDDRMTEQKHRIRELERECVTLRCALEEIRGIAKKAIEPKETGS